MSHLFLADFLQNLEIPGDLLLDFPQMDWKAAREAKLDALGLAARIIADSRSYTHEDFADAMGELVSGRHFVHGAGEDLRRVLGDASLYKEAAWFYGDFMEYASFAAVDYLVRNLQMDPMLALPMLLREQRADILLVHREHIRSMDELLTRFMAAKIDRECKGVRSVFVELLQYAESPDTLRKMAVDSPWLQRGEFWAWFPAPPSQLLEDFSDFEADASTTRPRHTPDCVDHILAGLQREDCPVDVLEAWAAKIVDAAQAGRQSWFLVPDVMNIVWEGLVQQKSLLVSRLTPLCRSHPFLDEPPTIAALKLLLESGWRPQEEDWRWMFPHHTERSDLPDRLGVFVEKGLPAHPALLHSLCAARESTISGPRIKKLMAQGLSPAAVTAFGIPILLYFKQENWRSALSTWNTGAVAVEAPAPDKSEPAVTPAPPVPLSTAAPAAVPEPASATTPSRTAPVYTVSQQDMSLALEEALSIFLAREWKVPSFPWPLIVSPGGTGVHTVIQRVAEQYRMGYFQVNAAEWIPLGAYKSIPTATSMASFVRAHPVGIIHLRRLDGLSRRIIQEHGWYSNISTEMIALLDGQLLRNILSAEGCHKLHTRFLIVGSGRWQTDVDTQGVTTPKFEETDMVEGDDKSRMGFPAPLRQRFSSKPLVMQQPQVAEWENILRVKMSWLDDASIRRLAQEAFSRPCGLQEMGDLLMESERDRPNPGLRALIKQINPGVELPPAADEPQMPAQAQPASPTEGT